MAKQLSSRQSKEKHEAILCAAATEFTENGYEQTSMDAIAARAQVSKRTVYKHFSSKEQLFQAIVISMMVHANTAEDTTYQPGVALGDQLFGICRSIVGRFCDERFIKLSRVILSRILAAPELLTPHTDQRLSAQHALVAWIEAAVSAGTLDVDDPQYAAEELTGMLRSFLYWPQVTLFHPVPSARKRNAVIRRAVSMFLSHYST